MAAIHVISLIAQQLTVLVLALLNLRRFQTNYGCLGSHYNYDKAIMVVTL